MPAITCYRCFAQFPPRRLHFKCLMHRVEDEVLGPDAPLIFPWKGSLFGGPPRNAVCPRDRLHTGFRVCPHCRLDLPYYVGRFRQQIVAITGGSATGKTVYLWSLLYQLREVLARDPDPFAVAMFEDDTSSAIYQHLCRRVLHDRYVPDATQAEEQRMGDLPPVIVRMIRAGRRRPSLCNLIFYDPAGELIESLDDIRYLRYLAHSEAIIYLVGSPEGPNDPMLDARASLASEGLGSIARQVRAELGIGTKDPLPQTLAVAITKADQFLFRDHEPAELIAGHGQGQAFWRQWGKSSQQAVDRVSGRCEQQLRDLGYDDLVAKARLNFREVRYFAFSSLGKPPNDGHLEGDPVPTGVENPLFWILQSLQ